MEIGDILDLKTETMSFGSAAVARIENLDNPRPLVVFVEGACPDERVQARITRVHKNYCEAEIVEIKEPSSNRVKPSCLVAEKCGGCQWQHLSYSAQLEAKRGILLHQISRASGLEVGQLKDRVTVHPATDVLGYRTRIQVHGDHRGMGFFERGSHNIVYTDRCLTAHPEIQNEWSHFARQAAPESPFKVEFTRMPDGTVKTVLNRKHAAFGFTQVNPLQNEVLVNVVHTLATREGEHQPGILFDLYGGEGNLSKTLVERFTRVYCVDSYNEGVDSTELHGCMDQNFLLVRSDVESFLTGQYWREANDLSIDCVIADPPRTGMGPEVCALLANLKPSRLILVSCETITLARDLRAFLPTYQIEEIHLVDMFPQTYHVESVISLNR